jgi:hypothetical protein
MPALVAGIHVFTISQRHEDVDGRDKPGHGAEHVALFEQPALVGLFDDVSDLVGLGVDNDDRAVGHKKPVRAQRRDLLR